MKHRHFNKYIIYEWPVFPCYILYSITAGAAIDCLTHPTVKPFATFSLEKNIVSMFGDANSSQSETSSFYELVYPLVNIYIAMERSTIFTG